MESTDPYQSEKKMQKKKIIKGKMTSAEVSVETQIFYCVPVYHSHSIIDYKRIHIHLLQFAFLLLILKIKQLYIILKSTTDRCSPKLFTKLSTTAIQGCQLVPFACLVRPQVFYKPSCQTKSNFLLLNHHIIQVGSGPFLLRTLPVLDD